MQDSNVKYNISVEGTAKAVSDFKTVETAAKKASTAVGSGSGAASQNAASQDEVSKSTDKVTQSVNRASKAQEGYIFHIAKTTILSAGVNKAFLGLTSAAGDAVKQVDLMQNFPASMAALGLSSADASASILKLRDYAAQTGISLSEATTSVTRFAEVTKNVKAATAEFIGVKNALIAGGAGAEVQSNALEQLTQSYSRGKPQLIEWRSLMVAMPAQLNLVAKAMNLPNAQALGESLTKGKISMQDFVTELTKLSTGTGPIVAQAQARMQGIEFAGNVMKNALVNGLAAIYQAVGRQNIVSFFTFLTEVIRVLAQWAVIAINDLIDLFNIISRVFGGPQVKNFAGTAADAAGALGTGAANANDMASGLGNAADNAAKINKSLASFDKMNVLPDKTSGSAANSGAGGTGPLDPTTAALLDGIFGDIGNKLKSATEAAKIFAGILAGLGANALIAKLFGINPLKGLLSGLDDAARGLLGLDSKAESAQKKLEKLSAKGGEDSGKSWGTKFGEAAGKGVGKLGGILAGIAGGLAASISEAVGPSVIALVAPVGEALAAAGAAIIAFFAGIPLVIIALIVIAVAAIGVAIFLIVTHWTAVWTEVKKISSKAWQDIQKIWDGVTAFFVGLWQSIYTTLQPAIDVIKGIFNGIIGFFKQWGVQILEVILSPFILVAAAIIATFQNTVNFFVGIWQGIQAVFSVVVDFFTTVFTAAWGAITAVWDVVVGYFQTIWDGIVGIFNQVTAFMGTVFSTAWDAVVAVWGTVSAWFDTTVIQPVITLFTPITNFISGVFSRAWDGVKFIWSQVIAFFLLQWNGIMTIFNGVTGFFGSVFAGAYNAITGVFSGLWAWFKANVWDRIVSLFSGVGTSVSDGITGAFKGVFNTVLQALGGIWNKFVGTLNSAINTVNKLPGVNLQKIGTWTVPQLAKGGVVDQATMAILGEHGSEAVIPLENNTEWIDTLAAKLNAAVGGGSGQPVQLTVQIGEDKIVTKVINLINEKTQMSGRNTILV